MLDKFLFLLVPHNCGSTFIHRALAESKNVAAFKNDHGLTVDGHQVVFLNTPDCNNKKAITRAGLVTNDDSIILSRVKHFKECPICFKNLLMPHDMVLDALRSFMRPEKRAIIEDPNSYRWDKIIEIWSEEWHRFYWLTTPPIINVEKTIYSLLIPNMLLEQFSKLGEVFFLTSIRDPYAICEGIKRRNKIPVEDGIVQWIELAKKQKENAETLPRNIVFTYEQLCNKPQEVTKQIQDMLSGLEDLTFQKEILVHAYDGTKARTVQNFNDLQISKLSADEIKTINNSLLEHEDLLSFWGYSMRSSE